jgi:hypothetical protein
MRSLGCFRAVKDACAVPNSADGGHGDVRDGEAYRGDDDAGSVAAC